MIYHILKDGSQPKNIDDHVIKMDDAKTLYDILLSIKKRNDLKFMGGKHEKN